MPERYPAPNARKDNAFALDEIPDSFKKSVGVVQVAMGKLGFLHRKIYNVMLANAYAGLGRGKTQFRLSISTLAEMSGCNSNNYAVIYDHCRDLMATEVLTLEFDTKKQKSSSKRKIGGTTLISEFDVVEGGEIFYSFSPKMASVIHDPEQYIWMTLSTQNKFSSKYELNLFENTIRFVGVGSTGFKKIDEWKMLLGAEKSTYDEFKHFNIKVIKKATEGVNNKSNIILKPEYERENRKIKKLKFIVRENPQLSLLNYKAQEQIRSSKPYKDGLKLGMTDAEAVYWIEKKGENYLSETIDYVSSRKNLTNVAGYLITALRKGYGEKSPEERRRVAEASQRKATQDAERDARAVKAKAEKALQAQWSEQRREWFEALASERTPAELAEFGEVVLGALPRLVAVRDRWRELGKDHRRLGDQNLHDKTIRPVVISEGLKRWGTPEHNDFEAFRISKRHVA